jgi:hypothetical protein
MPDVITLSVSRADDAEDLVAFYTSNPHDFYAFRDDATHQAANDGRFILARRGHALVAAAGLFPVIVPGETEAYFELGQARSLQEVRGLYRWIVWLRLLRAETIGIPRERIYSEIDEPNVRVQDALQRLGFEVFLPLDSLTDAAVTALPPDKRPDALGYGFVFLRPTPTTYSEAYAALDLLAAGEVTRPDQRLALRCAPESLARLRGAAKPAESRGE